MIFLMLLSLLQICFIPGFIVYIYLNRNTDDKDSLFIPVFSFAISLIINYIIVFSLAYFNLYTRGALIILLLIELFALTGLFVLRKINNGRYNVKMIFAETRQEINLLFDVRKYAHGLIQSVLFIFSVLLLIYLSVIFIIKAGSIFNAWDAVFSWNRWAVDFYHNKLPSGTWHYPQLLPANWSIAYVLSGYPLQFIPKGIMPLFLIFIVYSFIITGIKERSLIYFIASIFSYQTMMRFHWTDGDVDVPVAFFSVLIYISLFLVTKAGNKKSKRKYLILSALFVCGSAVTKQAGIFLVIVYPILLLIFTKHSFSWNNKKIAEFLGFFLAMIVIIVVPFYLHTELAIRNGLEKSEINVVTNDIYNGASYLERFFGACSLFTTSFSSILLFSVVIFLFLFSFADRTFRILNLSVVIPYFIIWAIFFSYDLRNFAIMFPYICLGAGVGFDIFSGKIKQATFSR